MKVGLLKCREEPPKLLQGTKFQERTFQIKEHKLLLLKDKKVGALSLQTLWGTSQCPDGCVFVRASDQRRSGL